MTDRKTDAAVKTLFESELMPLAAKLKAAGHSFLDVKHNPSAATYYIKRTKRTMDRADFETLADLTPESLPRVLTTFWKHHHREALLSLIPSITKLAAALHATQRQDEDVSPFVYMMY